MFSPARPGIQERLADLELNFAAYVEKFNATPPFGLPQRNSHLQTLELRRRFKHASEAAHDAAFTSSLHQTLRLWSIGVRFTKIVPLPIFRDRLASIAMTADQLEEMRIDDSAIDPPRVAHLVWQIIRDFDVITKDRNPVQNKVVSGTKTLHHLLPELIFPMDREYTQTFFMWVTTSFQYHPEDCFAFAFSEVAQTAKIVNPSTYIGGGWNSCRSKVLDNAIVGYCMAHGLMSENKKRRRRDQELLKSAKRILKAGGNWDEFQRLQKAGKLDEAVKLLTESSE